MPHISSYMDKTPTTITGSSPAPNAVNDASSSASTVYSNTQGTTSDSSNISKNTDLREDTVATAYKDEEALLLKQFFAEMEKKNYPAADKLCREIEQLAEDANDPEKIESAKELRRTYQAIVD